MCRVGINVAKSEGDNEKNYGEMVLERVCALCIGLTIRSITWTRNLTRTEPDLSERDLTFGHGPPRFGTCPVSVHQFLKFTKNWSGLV